MHTSHILTQVLNQAAPIKIPAAPVDNNSAANFKQALQKEVQSQNRPTANNTANKTPTNKLEKNNASSPPPQASKPVDDANATNTNLEQTDVQQAASDQTNDDQDDSVIALIDQIGQLNQLAQNPQIQMRQDADTSSDQSIAADSLEGSTPRGKQRRTDLISSDTNRGTTDATESNQMTTGDAISFAEQIATGETSTATSAKELKALSQDDAISFETKNTPLNDKTLTSALPAGQASQVKLVVPQDTASTEVDSETTSILTAVASLRDTETPTNESKAPIKTAEHETDIDDKLSTNNNKLSNGDFKQILATRAEGDKFSVKFGSEHGTQTNTEQAKNAINATSSVQAQPPSATELAKLNEVSRANAASDHIGPRLGTKAWDQAIGQKLVWMVAGGDQSAELSLNPPDLGPVQVVLSVSDNQVDASFISSHLEVREAIEAAAPRLREMMDNAGMSLSGFSVSSGNAQTSFQEQSGSGSQRSFSTNNEVEKNLASNTRAEAAAIRAPQGAVDTFV